MTEREMNAMLWISDRWWWFPGSQIGADSEFEWRGSGVYLLKADGTAVEGILFVGEVVHC